MEEKEPSYTVTGKVNWYSHVENSMKVPQKTKVELLCDSAIPLLGIYLEKNIIQKQTWIPMFIAILFAMTLVAQMVKNLPAVHSRRPGSIPESVRSSGEGNSNSLQFSCLENPIDSDAW